MPTVRRGAPAAAATREAVALREDEVSGCVTIRGRRLCLATLVDARLFDAGLLALAREEFDLFPFEDERDAVESLLPAL